jgi:hypothetical protein
MAARRGRWLLLVLLGLVFFIELVLHPGQTLYSDYSDLLTLHLPSKRFLVRSWQETGEIPLWCPYNFAGMPFVHDIQVSAFYPFHLPLFLLPETWLGAALSWLIVLHVIGAGLAMYAYARHQGLEGPGAFVAALGYMFAGKWLLHLLAGGHYNMVPLAWLPLVLLWLEQAIQRGSLLRASWAGAAFSMLILGAYPYVTLYGGLFVALWSLGTVLAGEGGLSMPLLVRWLGHGLWTILVAMALGAVQLLPGLEASGEASRSGGVGVSSETFLNGLRSLVGLVGPSLSNEPNSWENRAGFGILWLTLAAFAPRVGGAKVRFQAAICLVLFLFALGGAAIVQGLPGFRLFRLPSRMFLIAAFPVALLAGVTTQALFGHPGVLLAIRLQLSRALLKVTGVVVVLAGIFVLLLLRRSEIEPQWHPYWATLLITVPGFCWLLGGGLGKSEAIIWVGLLLVDLVTLSWPLVEVRPDAEILQPSPCVRYLADHAGDRGRVLDFNPEGNAANHTPLWPGLPAVVGVEPVRGFNPIDIHRYKEYLQFITEEDRPLQVLDQMWTGPILGTFPIKNQNLADLLGIRYLLQPSELPLEATVQDAEGRACWQKVMEDADGITFNFISVQPSGRDCGLQALPMYTVYENGQAFPRAFVVAEALPLPSREKVLECLKSNDFRQRVFLENWPGQEEKRSEATRSPSETKWEAGATVTQYLPNHIDVSIDHPDAGFLVLTDIWYPGWTCQVDGKPTPIYRANFLFRAVALPPGARQVVFTFAPFSYAVGKMISGLSVLALLVASAVGFMRLFSGALTAAREEKQELHAVLN